MLGGAHHKIVQVEAVLHHFIKQQERGGQVFGQQAVHQPEVVVVVENVQILHHLFVGEVVAAEGHHLVEHRQGVAQAAVGFLGQQVQGVVFGRDTFLSGHVAQVAAHVLHLDAAEIKNLTARQDGGDNLVALSGGEDENGVARRLLQRL